MKVICLKNTKKLVKGSIYEVLYLNNLDNKTSHYFRPSITIRLNDFSNCSFGIANFKLENGKNLPEINWSSDEWKNTKIENSKSIIGDSNPVKVGDYVTYLRNAHKSLINGRIYRISDVRQIKHTFHNGSTWAETEIQVEGSSRFYKTYSFGKCNPQKAREISLSSLFDQETGVELIDKSTRKIDKYDPLEKEKLLIKILMSASFDINRNNMTIIEWACRKTGNQFSVEPNDFNAICDLPVSKLIEKLD
jgi:hypothetical protein